MVDAPTGQPSIYPCFDVVAMLKSGVRIVCVSCQKDPKDCSCNGID